MLLSLLVTRTCNGPILSSQIIWCVAGAFWRARPTSCFHLSGSRLGHQACLSSLLLLLRRRRGVWRLLHLRLINMVQFGVGVCICALGWFGSGWRVLLASLRIWNVLISAGTLRSPRTSETSCCGWLAHDSAPRITRIYLSWRQFGLLNVSENSQTPLRRYQTRHDLLCYILGRSAQEIFKLYRAELLNNGWLFGNGLLETRFKFMQFSLLFVEVLDQASTSLLHLIQTTLQANPVGCLVALAVLDFVTGHWILRVPNIVRDEFLNLRLPARFKLTVANIFYLVH